MVNWDGHTPLVKVLGIRGHGAGMIPRGYPGSSLLFLQFFSFWLEVWTIASFQSHIPVLALFILLSFRSGRELEGVMDSKHY